MPADTPLDALLDRPLDSTPDLAPWPPVIAHVVEAAESAHLSRKQAHQARQRAAVLRYGSPPAQMWMVCGNVVETRAVGSGGTLQRSGIRLLKPGAKVMVCRLWRTASPERVTVVGRRRRVAAPVAP